MSKITDPETGKGARVWRGELRTSDHWTGWILALLVLDHLAIAFLLFVAVTR